MEMRVKPFVEDNDVTSVGTTPRFRDDVVAVGVGVLATGQGTPYSYSQRQTVRAGGEASPLAPCA